MDKEILEEKVYYYKDSVLEFDKLIKTINELDTLEEKSGISSWVEWKASDFIYGSKKKYNIDEINLLENPYKEKMAFVYDTVQKSFYNVAKDYGVSINDIDQPLFYPEFYINKYRPQSGMGAHFDQGTYGTTLRYTLVMYLNDDFDGGEISFKLSEYKDLDSLPSVDIEYDVAVKENHIDFGLKPKAGSILVFPSSAPYHHTAHLIKNGSKIMIQSHWIQNNTEKEE